jgi:hypothetical protein
MQDTDAGLLCSVREQHGLEELLIAAMRVLGRRPDRVRACCGRRATLSPRRDGYARELNAGDARGRDDVVGVVRRQPNAAQFVRQSESPEDLHRARADLTALHVRWVVRRTALGDHDVDAAPSQIDGQRQPDRATADNQHSCPHTTNARWCLPAILGLE